MLKKIFQFYKLISIIFYICVNTRYIFNFIQCIYKFRNFFIFHSNFYNINRIIYSPKTKLIKSIHLKDLDGRENTKLTIVNGKCISINFAFLNNHALYDFHYYIMLNDSVTYLKLKKRFSGNSQKEWCVMLKNENDTRLKYLSNNIVKTKDWFVINLESAIKNEQ